MAAVAALAWLAVAAAPVRADVSNGWNLVYQTGGGDDFISVAADSKNDAWAVGMLGSGAYRPLIRHWNGKSWLSVSLPGSPQILTDAVTASSPKNVWIFGETKREVAEAFRYDGSHWHRMPVSGGGEYAVAVGAHDLWMTGENSHGDDVFHWNGSRWTAYKLGLSPEAIAGTSGTNVWAAGVNAASKVVAYRWIGTRWITFSMPHPKTSARIGLSVSASTGTWMSWYTTSGGEALHWDGHHWHQMALDVGFDAPLVSADGVGGVWFGPWAYWTGSAWIEPVGTNFSAYSVDIVQVAWIPGTHSYWSAGDGSLTSSSADGAWILRDDA